MKYLLTTGDSTDKVENYILDLFKLYFVVNPDEIPNSSIGFNKILTDVNKVDIINEVKSRITKLISNFQSRFEGVKINLTNIEMIDETIIKVVISANSETESYEINSGLY